MRCNRVLLHNFAALLCCAVARLSVRRIVFALLRQGEREGGSFPALQVAVLEGQGGGEARGG